MLPCGSLTWSWPVVMFSFTRSIFLAIKLQVGKARFCLSLPFFSGSCSQTDGNFTPIEGSQPLEAFSSMWLSQFLNLALGLAVLKSSCSTRLHQQVLHQHQVGFQCLPEAPVISLQPCRRIHWLLSTKECNLRQPILRFSLLQELLFYFSTKPCLPALHWRKKKKGRKDYSAGSGRTPGRPDTQASSTQGKRSKGLARLHFKTNTIKQAKISVLELTKMPTPRSPWPKKYSRKRGQRK